MKTFLYHPIADFKYCWYNRVEGWRSTLLNQWFHCRVQLSHKGIDACCHLWKECFSPFRSAQLASADQSRSNPVPSMASVLSVELIGYHDSSTNAISFYFAVFDHNLAPVFLAAFRDWSITFISISLSQLWHFFGFKKNLNIKILSVCSWIVSSQELCKQKQMPAYFQSCMSGHYVTSIKANQTLIGWFSDPACWLLIIAVSSVLMCHLQ